MAGAAKGGAQTGFQWKPAIRAALEAAATLHELPPSLVRAVAYVESRGNPAAVSPVGARGLMQIMPETGRDLGLKDPFDPVDNARAGAKYLAHMIAQFGNVETALHAYNWGPGNVARAIAKGKEIPASVQRYAADVLARMEVERSNSDPFSQAASVAKGSACCFSCPGCGLSLAIEVREAKP